MEHYVASSNVRTDFLKTESPRYVLAWNALLALLYLATLLLLFTRGNPVLFWLLIAGEVFHVWQVLTFIHTVWDTRYEAPHADVLTIPVDVFITTAGEPIPIVEETARAAVAMRYEGVLTTYLLNDGYVAKKDNWREVEALAARLDTPLRPVRCITRTVPGGA